MPLTAEQRAHSLQVSLADLTARASGHYASKRFDDAAEVYAQAAEMQAEMNGEMAPENAEILFLYGRSLFRVGQSKSDVLGGKAPETEGQQAKGGKSKKGKVVKKKKGPNGAAAGAAGSSKEEQELVAEKVVEEAAKIVADEAAAAEVKTEKKELEEKKPLFQFTGDENWDDSDEEEDEGAEDEDGEEGEDEVEDDLGTAFEILDLSRVLFLKQLEDKTAAAASASSAYEDQGKGKEVANGGAEQGDHSDATLQHIKERLADTHDLLAEISLENERYVSTRVSSAPLFHEEILEIVHVLTSFLAAIPTQLPTPESPSSTRSSSWARTTRSSLRRTSSSRSRSSLPRSPHRRTRLVLTRVPRRSTRSCATRPRVS